MAKDQKSTSKPQTNDRPNRSERSGRIGDAKSWQPSIDRTGQPPKSSPKSKK